MRPEARTLLEDMSTAARRITEFTANRGLADYLADQQLRWSVERGFEIIGEALNQLNKIEPCIAARISEHRKIVSFRHVLIHAYSRISDEKTWDIVQNDPGAAARTRRASGRCLRSGFMAERRSRAS